MYSSKEILANTIAKFGLDESSDYPHVVNKLAKDAVANFNYKGPLFLVGLPACLGPLAKESSENPFYSERALGFVGGLSLCELTSAQTDPVKLEREFDEQDSKNEGPLHVHKHEDFLEALKYGMPPVASFSLGLSRLHMLLCDKKDVKDVLLYPQIRGQGKSKN